LTAGFLCLVCAQKYTSQKKRQWLVLASLSLALALLSHYDALFFLIPLFFIVGSKNFLKIFGVGAVLSLIYYLPSLSLGYFETNTLGYLSKRLDGSGYLTNNSLYTITVYNPLFVYLILLLVFALVGISRANKTFSRAVLVWFSVPFVVFQFVMLNPGTHVHNYVLPLIVLAGLGFQHLATAVGKYKPLLTSVAVGVLVAVACIQTWVYVPKFNKGYPWQPSRLLSFSCDRVLNSYHLYLYGFPYNRGWDEVGTYFADKGGIRNFYTNDNETSSQYYAGNPPYRTPGSNFLPQYYVEVAYPQELKEKNIPPLAKLYTPVFETNSGMLKLYKYAQTSI